MIFLANPHAAECVICDGPCIHDDGEAEVTAEGLARLIEIGAVVPVPPPAKEPA